MTTPIPASVGKKLFSRSNKKLAEKRREGIDSYVQALLRLTSNIVDSDLVQQFFNHRTTDPVGLDSRQEGETLHAAGTVAAATTGHCDDFDEDLEQELEERKIEEITAERDTPNSNGPGNSLNVDANLVPAEVETEVR